MGNPVASRQPLNRRKRKNKATKMTKNMAKTQLSQSITLDLAQTSSDLLVFLFFFEAQVFNFVGTVEMQEVQ